MRELERFFGTETWGREKENKELKNYFFDLENYFFTKINYFFTKLKYFFDLFQCQKKVVILQRHLQ